MKMKKKLTVSLIKDLDLLIVIEEIKCASFLFIYPKLFIIIILFEYKNELYFIAYVQV